MATITFRAVDPSFYDGEIHNYAPSLVETLLGLGGVAVAALIVIVALKVLRLLPEKLDNSALVVSHIKPDECRSELARDDRREFPGGISMYREQARSYGTPHAFLID